MDVVATFWNWFKQGTSMLKRIRMIQRVNSANEKTGTWWYQLALSASLLLVKQIGDTSGL
jgi:hypothetical protein